MSQNYFDPTMELRWVRPTGKASALADNRLQQKWIEFEYQDLGPDKGKLVERARKTGKADWRDVQVRWDGVPVVEVVDATWTP